MHWLFAIALLSVPLVVGEMLKKKVTALPPELSRKFVHITAAVCAACLPLVLSLQHISLLAIAMTPGMVYMHHKGTLHSMSSRSHRSYGDVFFGLGCAGAALLANNVPTYVTAVLLMGLADGLAGLIPTHKTSRVLVTPGTKKPLVGRIAFFVITLVIMAIAARFIPIQPLAAGHILIAALCLTILEQVSPYGSDNVTVPIGAALLLNLS
jgi:phytol kinase